MSAPDQTVTLWLEQIFASGHTVLMHRTPAGDYFVAASGLEGGKTTTANARSTHLDRALCDLALKCKARRKSK